MPEKYIKIRNSMRKKGKSDKQAKRSAARIYNSQRTSGQKPVTASHLRTAFKG